MISFLVGAISVFAVIQFFISYCRSILTAAGRIELSPRVMNAADLPTPKPEEEEFDRLLELAELCPVPGRGTPETGAIVAYHNALGVLRHVAAGRLRGVDRWVDHERSRCTYFAAVVLDQRMGFTQDLLREFLPNH